MCPLTLGRRPFRRRAFLQAFCVVALSFSSTLFAQQVDLAWDPSPDSTVIGYRIHYGPSSGTYPSVIDVGNNTSATVSNLPTDTTYFVVTAYDADALESDPSNEVSFTPSQPPPNQSPTVSLSSPEATVTLVAPAALDLLAAASDPDGTVARVEFYNGATKLGELTSAPYSLSLASLSSGTYSFTAIAYDDKGASTASTPLTITISAPQPVIGSVALGSGGIYQIAVNAEAGHTYTIAASNDLGSWSTLGTVQTTSGTTVFNDSTASSLPQRFYRVSDGTFVSRISGFTKLTLRGASKKQTSQLTYLSIPLTNPTAYTGSISSFGVATITDANASWPDAQFNLPTGQFYLEITSGPNAGLTADIVGTDGPGKTLTLGEDLSPALQGGEQFVVREQRTLANVFGAANSAQLKSGSSVKLADEVQIFDPVNQTVLQYYYQTGAATGGTGWRSATDPSTDAGSTILYLEQGLIVCRKNPGNLNLLVTGEAKTGPTLIPIGVNNTLVANCYAGGQLTLQNSGLYTGNGSTGLTSGSNASSADNVQLFDGQALTTYYYRSGSGWRRSGDTTRDAGGTPILPGTSFYVTRKAGRAPFTWAAQQPF